MGHVHSFHREEYNVNYLAARSGSSAREHVCASLIELLTRVCVRVCTRAARDRAREARIATSPALDF